MSEREKSVEGSDAAVAYDSAVVVETGDVTESNVVVEGDNKGDDPGRRDRL